MSMSPPPPPPLPRPPRRHRRSSYFSHLAILSSILYAYPSSASNVDRRGRRDGFQVQKHHHLRVHPRGDDSRLGWSKLCSRGCKMHADNIHSESYLVQLRGGDNEATIVCNEQQQPSTTASSSPPSNQKQQPSPFEYLPVTALDNYGQSAQLRHAMESANRFGTPVLACICCHDDSDNDEYTDANENTGNADRVENAIVVCSLQRPRPGVIVSPPPASGGSIASRKPSSSVHPSIQGMVRILATSDDDDDIARPSDDDVPKHALHTAIVTTGIRSDAQFLLSRLQSHVNKHWFRYDVLPSSSSASPAVAKMARDVLLDCMGYDRAEEECGERISGGIGSAAPSYEEDEDGNGGNRAGRPLGVCSFLFGLDYSSAAAATMHRRRPVFITVVKANGASQQYVAHAMGAGCQLANEKLSQRWRRRMSRGEARDMMSDVLKDVAREMGWMPQLEHGNDGGEGRNGSAGLTVACETVTSMGIDTEFIPI